MVGWCVLTKKLVDDEREFSNMILIRIQKRLIEMFLMKFWLTKALVKRKHDSELLPWFAIRLYLFWTLGTCCNYDFKQSIVTNPCYFLAVTVGTLSHLSEFHFGLDVKNELSCMESSTLVSFLHVKRTGGLFFFFLVWQSLGYIICYCMACA